MSKYRDAILTDKGLDFVRRAANGKIEITFTKGVMSAEDHTKDSDQTIQGLTSLNGFVQSDSINYTMPVDAENVSVPLRFYNTNMAENNYIYTIGIYATDGTNEILHSVVINDDPELFSAYNGKTPESVKMNSTTQVGRASQVSAQVSPLGMVTEEEYQSGMASKVSFSGGVIYTGNGSFVPAAVDTVNSQLAAKANVTDVNNSFASTTANINSSLASMVTYSNGYITTGNGTFVPAAVDTVNSQLASKANTADVATSIANVTNTVNNTIQPQLASMVTYSGGYITTGNGSFVPAAINDVTSSIAIASSAASSAIASTAQQEVNDIGSVNTALSSKVSFSGGTIFTGNGSFVPASTDTVNAALQAINNGLSGVSPKPLGDSGDFYNLPLGIYFVNGNPANNPYGHACYGTAFSMGGYVQYLDQNGDAFFITPKSGGWLKYTKQSDVVTLQNQMNGVLARQSNLMQQLANIYADGSLNNLSAIAQTGGTINLTMYNTTPQNPISTVTCVYSFLTNSITINGNYTLNPGQFLWIGLEPLIPYFKGWNTSAVTIHLNNPVDFFDWDVIGDGQTWNHVELRLRQSMQGWTGYSFNSFVNTIIALSHQ